MCYLRLRYLRNRTTSGTSTGYKRLLTVVAVVLLMLLFCFCSCHYHTGLPPDPLTAILVILDLHGGMQGHRWKMRFSSASLSSSSVGGMSQLLHLSCSSNVSQRQLLHRSISRRFIFLKILKKRCFFRLAIYRRLPAPILHFPAFYGTKQNKIFSFTLHYRMLQFTYLAGFLIIKCSIKMRFY